LVHQLGDPEVVMQQADVALQTSGFLQHWIAFEVFLKATSHQMLRRHPERIRRRHGGAKFELDEILTWSNNFSSSMKQFQDSLIEHELVAVQADQGSVPGAIKYLKDNFSSESDPYEAPYTYDSEERRTSYMQLVQLKELRNALTHEGEQADDDDGVDNIEYEEAVLTMKSIAGHIANMIVSGEYSLRS
jgi:hypothetical protein